MISDSSATGDNIELMAPGENVVSTGMYGAKYALSGTSVAAPHVTAVASIIKSIYPEMSGTVSVTSGSALFFFIINASLLILSSSNDSINISWFSKAMMQ